jgi:hypothetical protein
MHHIIIRKKQQLAPAWEKIATRILQICYLLNLTQKFLQIFDNVITSAQV